jgi:hypothetical protein
MMMDQKVMDLLMSVSKRVDPEMVEDAAQAHDDLYQKWVKEGKKGPFFVPILVDAIRTYLTLGHGPETLPLIVSVVWAQVEVLANRAKSKKETEKA